MSLFNLIWGWIMTVLGIIGVIGYGCRERLVETGFCVLIVFLGVMMLDEYWRSKPGKDKNHRSGGGTFH